MNPLSIVALVMLLGLFAGIITFVIIQIREDDRKYYQHCGQRLFSGWKCKLGNDVKHIGLPCALVPRWWNIRWMIRYYLR